MSIYYKSSISTCSTQEDQSFLEQELDNDINNYLRDERITRDTLSSQKDGLTNKTKVLSSNNMEKLESQNQVSGRQSPQMLNKSMIIKKKRPLRIFSPEKHDSEYVKQVLNKLSPRQSDQNKIEQPKFIPEIPKNLASRSHNKQSNERSVFFIALKLLFLPIYITYVIVCTLIEALLTLFHPRNLIKYGLMVLKTTIQIILILIKKMLFQTIQPSPKKLNLVLDLDETLIHATKKRICETQTQFEFKKNGNSHVIYVKERPHLALFFQKMSKMYQIYIYTAGGKEYADTIIKNIIDPQGQFITKTFYRDSCIYLNQEKQFTKSLKNIGVKVSQSILIDNNVQNLSEDINNSFLIHSFRGEKEDNQLQNFAAILENISNQYHEREKNLQKLVKIAKLKYL